LSCKANVITIAAAVNFAILPIKGLVQGKSRLARFLPEEARRVLSQAMFLDVLGSLLHASSVCGVAVVTSDRLLLDLARRRGVFTVDEGYPRGLNGAVALGSEFCLQQGATSLLVLLADLPLVTPADVDCLFHQVNGGPEVILVPSKDGQGVNALFRVPPEVVPPCFGGPSLEAHRVAAKRQGIPCRIIEVPNIAFDIDSVEDLELFASQATDTHTYRETHRLGLF